MDGEQDIHRWRRDEDGNLTFDGAGSHGKVSDIRRYLVEDYLARCGSPLAGSGMPNEDLYREMGLLDEYDGRVRPINAALLFFNEDPTEFIPYARIELGLIDTPDGDNIEENTFTGPIDAQLVSALMFIRNRVIRTRVHKVYGVAESERRSNYDFEAVSEMIVNAALHHDYRSGQPIRIYVYRDSITISGVPGPSSEVSDEDIALCRMPRTTSRNPCVRHFLEGLGLTGGNGMGIIDHSVRARGHPAPVLTTDARRSFLRIRFPIHPAFRIGPIMEPVRHIERRSYAEMELEALQTLDGRGWLRASGLARMMGYSRMTPSLRRCLNSLIESGRVECLYPENPNDPRQKIRRVR